MREIHIGLGMILGYFLPSNREPLYAMGGLDIDIWLIVCITKKTSLIISTGIDHRYKRKEIISSTQLKYMGILMIYFPIFKQFFGTF